MALEVFYSYSHKDAELREELDVHLSQLVRDGLIVSWADRRIAAGDEWRTQIDAHVRSAQIILLLVSPEFLASEYCYGIEMKIALERHAKEQAVVIPIILRPADWHSAPFAELQALPRDGKAVTLWPNRDEALAQITQAIRELVTRYQAPKPQPVETSPLHDQQIPKARVVDAAMPSHVVKDRATELLMLIRLPESKGLAGILQEDEEAEARPEDVRSRPFEVVFPLSPTGLPEPLKITVRLTSPDFSPPAQSKNIFVPVNRDSQVCSFLLTPLRTGPLLVVIELVWEDAERGNRRLRTTCVAESETPGVSAPLALVQMAVGVGGGKATPKEKRPAPGPVRHVGNTKAPRVYVDYEAESTQIFAMPPAPAAPAMSAPGVTSRQGGFLSKPFVKAGLVVCLMAVGSTFFLVQRPQIGPAATESPASRKSRANKTAAPPPLAVPAPERPAISAETENRLMAVTSKVQTTDETLEAVRRNLGREGLNLNADTQARIARMHSSLERAKQAVAAGNEAAAKENLASADALATKLLDPIGH